MPLREKDVATIAEQMRLRHYAKYMGYKPSLAFDELPTPRREKWLDEVRVAAELLEPYFMRHYGNGGAL